MVRTQASTPVVRGAPGVLPGWTGEDARRSTVWFFAMLAGFLQLSLEGVFGAVAGLREIAIGAVHHGVGVTVPKLVFHGVVAGLGAFVGLLGTLPAVGIVVKMVADTFWHGRPFEMRASIRMITGLGYAESWQRAMFLVGSFGVAECRSCELRDAGLGLLEARSSRLSNRELAPLVVGNQPLSEEDLTKIRAFAHEMDFQVLFLPGEPTSVPELRNISALRDLGAMEHLREAGDFDLSPVFDSSDHFLRGSAITTSTNPAASMKVKTNNKARRLLPRPPRVINLVFCKIFISCSHQLKVPFTCLCSDGQGNISSPDRHPLWR